MSHFVRLSPRAARIGPAERTARPMTVGPRNSHAQRDSLVSGPPRVGARPGVDTRPGRSPTRRIELNPRSDEGPGARLASLTEELLELRRDLVEGGLRGQLVVIEDLAVELVLERRAELVVALERRLEVRVRQGVGEGLAAVERRRVLP